MAAKTPRIQLQINVQGEKPREPQVLKATKRHLVCEYDGLVFKQPREEPSVENTPLNRGRPSPRAAASQRQQVAEPACQRGSSNTPGHVGVAVAVVQQATPSQQLRPTQSESLDAQCTGWFEVEAAAAGSEPVATALLDICRRFCEGGVALDDAVQQLRAGGSCAATPAPPPAAAPSEEVEQADYQVDLEARKAGLRARLAAHEEEIAAWERLMHEAEQYSGEPEEAADKGSAAAAPESDAAEPADIAELRKMHLDMNRHLDMQAEGLCNLVGDIEALVERSNRTALSLQAEYHQEKFRAFPHVDSPARLIKEIVKPPVKRVPAQQQPQQ